MKNEQTENLWNIRDSPDVYIDDTKLERRFVVEPNVCQASPFDTSFHDIRWIGK